MNLNGPRGQSPLERWVHHVTQSIVVAAIVAGTAALWSMNGNIERILVEIQRIKVDVADHEERLREIETVRPRRRSPSDNFPR